MTEKKWYQDQKNSHPKRKIKAQLQKIIRLIPPKDFRLLENYDEVMKYFENASNLLKKGQSVCFDTRKISHLSFETVALLMTKVKDRSYNPIIQPYISGYEPRDEKLKVLFERSGFRDWVHSTGGTTKNRIGGMFNYKNGLKVDADYIASLVQIIQKISNCEHEKQTYNLINQVLTEITSNTQEHASGQSENKIYNWWVIFMHDEENDCIKICVIDLGIGIFESLQRAGIYKKGYFPWKNTQYLSRMFASNEFISRIKKTTKMKRYARNKKACKQNRYKQSHTYNESHYCRY